MGCTGLSDGTLHTAVPPSPAYPGTAGTWQQGLWHDGTVELGWHMDTSNWKSNNGPFPPGGLGMTLLPMIGMGIQLYSSSGYNDIGTGITKTSYPNISQGIDLLGTAAGTVWANYTAEIDAGRPALVSFDCWVAAVVGNDNTFPGITIPRYSWNFSSIGHTVTGVGYLDYTPGFQNSGVDEWFVVHDTWGNTARYVAVPIDDMWKQTDFVYDVPEPGLITLLMIGSVALLRRRRE